MLFSLWTPYPKADGRSLTEKVWQPPFESVGKRQKEPPNTITWKTATKNVAICTLFAHFSYARYKNDPPLHRTAVCFLLDVTTPSTQRNRNIQRVFTKRSLSSWWQITFNKDFYHDRERNKRICSTVNRIRWPYFPCCVTNSRSHERIQNTGILHEILC